MLSQLRFYSLLASVAYDVDCCESCLIMFYFDMACCLFLLKPDTVFTFDGAILYYLFIFLN